MSCKNEIILRRPIVAYYEKKLPLKGSFPLL